MCIMFAPVEAVLFEEGGVKTPSTRKDLMLERRRSEDAEGDRRMIGSGRRPDTGLLGRRAEEAVVKAGVGPDGRAVVRRRNASVYLRMEEKSCKIHMSVR